MLVLVLQVASSPPHTVAEAAQDKHLFRGFDEDWDEQLDKQHNWVRGGQSGCLRRPWKQGHLACLVGATRPGRLMRGEVLRQLGFLEQMSQVFETGVREEHVRWNHPTAALPELRGDPSHLQGCATCLEEICGDRERRLVALEDFCPNATNRFLGLCGWWLIALPLKQKVRGRREGQHLGKVDPFGEANHCIWLVKVVQPCQRVEDLLSAQVAQEVDHVQATVVYPAVSGLRDLLASEGFLCRRNGWEAQVALCRTRHDRPEHFQRLSWQGVEDSLSPGHLLADADS
mmetsp:Transcript_2061/g.4026  ORF Transcript_2061/g.4026 Transcript_2061/m.4026 type:complete len:287 (+) Transcript_2061:389-1249(+)